VLLGGSGDEIGILEHGRNAARSAATRSAGTPGVVASGRPTVATRAMNSNNGLSAGLTAWSMISGTSGNSGSFSIPAWNQRDDHLLRNPGRLRSHPAE